MVLKRRIMLWLALLLALALPARGEASDYVRLHVIAADDTPAAQALKLEVRDAVLEAARDLLAGVGDADAAWARVTDGAGALEAAALRRAREEGYAGPVRCETGVFAFPDRVYGGVRVPAGDYRALRVVIGAGGGHNWWCVLFPTLCYPERYREEGTVYYSSILRWLRGVFGGGAS